MKRSRRVVLLLLVMMGLRMGLAPVRSTSRSRYAWVDARGNAAAMRCAIAIDIPGILAWRDFVLL